MPSIAKDFTGHRFGFLLAEECVSPARGGRVWRFRCDCGGVVDLPLKRAKMRGASCGCRPACKRPPRKTRPANLPELTAGRVRELLSYDSNTGEVRWRISRGQAVAGQAIRGINGDGYLTCRVEYRTSLVHRLAWAIYHGSWPNGLIDHINGIKTDNRICNLRVATPSVNSQNQRQPQRDNKTGFLGVCKKRGRFDAAISVNGKLIRIGSFASPEEAHQAYVRAKRLMHEGCTI